MGSLTFKEKTIRYTPRTRGRHLNHAHRAIVLLDPLAAVSLVPSTVASAATHDPPPWRQYVSRNARVASIASDWGALTYAQLRTVPLQAIIDRLPRAHFNNYHLVIKRMLDQPSGDESGREALASLFAFLSFQVHEDDRIGASVSPLFKLSNGQASFVPEDLSSEDAAAVWQFVQGADTSNILKAMKITPKRICYYTAASWKWQVYLKVLVKTLAGEAKINELMKEFAADKDLKPHMKDIAGMVPRVIKALTKMPNERKANILKIKAYRRKRNLG